LFYCQLLESSLSLNPLLSIVSLVASMGSDKAIGFCSFLYLSIQVINNSTSIPSELSASASKILVSLCTCVLVFLRCSYHLFPLHDFNPVYDLKLGDGVRINFVVCWVGEGVPMNLIKTHCLGKLIWTINLYLFLAILNSTRVSCIGSASGKSSTTSEAFSQFACLVMDIHVSKLDLAFGCFW
jgi:hypothetical protein